MATEFTSWNTTDAPNDLLYGPAVFANNKFTVLGRSDGTVATSTNGINWTITSDGTTTIWDRLVFGGGVYVAIKDDLSSMSYSINGLDWMPATPIGETFNNASIAYGNGVFVITTYRIAAPVQPVSITSPDGINWTVHEGAFAAGTYFRQAMTFGNGKFVATLNSAVNKSATSVDGISWTISSSTTPVATTWAKMAYGNGMYVTIDGQRTIMTSTDGEAWTGQTNPAIAGQNFVSIAFCNGIFVINGFKIAAGPAYNPFALFSSDGVNWVMNNPTTDTGIQYSTCGDNKIICTGPTGNSRIIYGLFQDILALISREIPPIGAIPIIDNNKAGALEHGIGVMQQSPRYIHAHTFMENILR